MEPLLPTLHVECLCAILRHMDIPRVDTVKDGSMKNLAVFNYPKVKICLPTKNIRESVVETVRRIGIKISFKNGSVFYDVSIIDSVTACQKMNFR